MTKWLIAIPFIAIPFIGLWTLGLPALIAGYWGWFLDDPWDTVFVLLWVGIWAGGTYFYQPARHRRRPGPNCYCPCPLWRCCCAACGAWRWACCLSSQHCGVVTSSLMAHHLPRRIKRAGFAEVCRVLKPDSHFMLCDFGPPPERWMWMTRLLTPLLRWGGEHPEDNIEWRIPALIEETGFAPAETVVQERFPWLFCIYFVSAYPPDDPTGKRLLGEVKSEYLEGGERR